MTDMLVRPASSITDNGTLQMHLSMQHRRCVIRLRGALVKDALQSMQPLFDRLGSLAFDQVIVDMRELAFIDESGAGMLLGLQHYVEGRQATLIGRCADEGLADIARAQGLRVDMAVGSIR
jgi:anti-anti-sigma factor